MTRTQRLFVAVLMVIAAAATAFAVEVVNCDYTPKFGTSGGGPLYAVLGNTESVASGAAVALSSAKRYHVITGTTTISTFTGGVEGQVAVLIYTGALTITNSSTDVVNTIHNGAFSTGTAPANFATTSATATNPYIKKYIFTANMPGFTNGQWFETGE